MKTNNITAYIKQASPVELRIIARELADMRGVCPAKCTDDAVKCFNIAPFKCAMHFKKWALQESK